MIIHKVEGEIPMTTSLADTDEIRFRYEIAGESIDSICADMKIYVTDLTALIDREGWVQQILPPTGQASEDQVNAFYKQGRMHLTRHMTHRAIKMYSRFAKLEDQVILALEDTLHDFDPSTPDATHNLSRIVSAYTKILDKQVLLHEALATPALVDKKIEAMLKNDSLTALLDQLDGKGRLLPSKD